MISLDQCGSEGWVLSYKVKGHWFDSQPGHIPGLWARSWVVGVWEATNWCFSTYWCFSPSLPPYLPLSKNKIFKKKDMIINHIIMYQAWCFVLGVYINDLILFLCLWNVYYYAHFTDEELSLRSKLDIYCCITTCHKFSSLKQHIYYFTVSKY